VAVFQAPPTPDETPVVLPKPVFSPDGAALAFGFYRVTEVTLWDVQTRAIRAVLRGHVENPLDLVFSPDSKWLTSAACGVYQGGRGMSTCVQGDLFIWDVANGERRAEIHPPLTQLGIGGQTFSPDGGLLVYSERAGLVVWDVAAQAARFRLPRHFGYRFSPDSDYLASHIYGEKLFLWETKTGAPVAQFEADKAQSYGLAYAFSHDSQTLAYTAADQSIRLWHIPIRREVAAFPLAPQSPIDLVFQPSGQSLAVVLPYQTFLADVRTGAARELYGCWGVNGGISWRARVSFNPDGTLLACQHGDVQVDLWRLDDLSRLWALRNGSYTGVEGGSAHSPDWRVWATHKDGNIVLWGVVK
jgi:WD40 repeat protein